MRSTTAKRAMLGGAALAVVAIVSLVALGEVHAGTLVVPAVVFVGAQRPGRVATQIADVLLALVMLPRMLLMIAILPIALVLMMFEPRRKRAVVPVPANERWKGVG